MVLRFGAFVMLALVPAGVLAQVQSQSQLDRFNQQLDETERRNRVMVDQSIPTGDRMLLDYGAYLTSAYVFLDDPAGNRHALRQFELVGYADVNLDGTNEFFVRLHSLYNNFDAGASFHGARDDYLTPRVERAFYRFDLQRTAGAYAGKNLDYNVVLTGGRQLVVWGNGLTLDQPIDGAMVTVTKGPFTLDAIGGITPNFDVDFDTSRPGFRTNTSRAFYGGMLGARVGQNRFYAYGLDQRDFNDDSPLVSHGVTTRFKYDSYYVGVGAAGNLSENLVYGAELVYEGGQSLSNSFDNATSYNQVAQRPDRIEAYAFDGRLDYAMADTHKTRLSGEMIIASGDSDRALSSSTFGGNRGGTHDNAFNGFGLLNTGLAFAPIVSNIAVERIGASTFPLPESNLFRQAQIGTDFFVYEKMRERGGIDEASHSGNYLGVESDLYLNWQITSDVSFVVRSGIFWAGTAIAGSRAPRDFFYSGVTYAF